MAGTFSEQAFEQKLVNLKDTQEAINALSQWCLQNKGHHKKIVMCWLHCLKRVKVDQRLSLFYLANDVVQYSKRKHLDFVDSWGTALQKATPLVRDEKVRNRVMRIFKIWEERGVYDETFISDLCGLLTTNVKKKEAETLDPNEFQPTALVKKIRECKTLEENTDSKHRRVQDFKLPLTDAESMRMSLKDRRHGSDIQAEVDSGVKKMEAYVKALEMENSSRERLIELLRQAMVFYETQRGEAKIVANAYRNFGVRLKTRQKALDELIPTLLSPLPSPDVDAPSPSPDHELELESLGNSFDVPPVVTNGGDLDFSFTSSFIGSAQFMDLQKEFSMTSSNELPTNDYSVSQINDVSTDEYNTSQVNDLSSSDQDGGQTIEVISSRPEPDQSFNASEFLKSLMPNKEPSILQPPPMPPVFGDWSSGIPWSDPPPDTPQSPVYEKQVPLVQPVEYDDPHPVPAIVDIDHRALLPILSSVIPGLDLTHNSVDNDTRLPPPPPPVPLQPPPSMGLDMDHRGLAMERTMDYPPAMVMEPHPRMNVPPPAIEHIPMLDSMRMDHLPPMRLEPPPNPPNMDVISHQLNIGRISALTMDRGAILAGPIKTQDLKPKPSVDVERRNLISLTGSPIMNTSPVLPMKSGGFGWDRREFGKDVNVESVDMDVSEEDDDESQGRCGDKERRHHGHSGVRRTEHIGEMISAMVGPRFSRPPNQTNFTEPQNYAEPVGEMISAVVGPRFQRPPGPEPTNYGDPVGEMISAVVGPRFQRPPGPEPTNYGDPIGEMISAVVGPRFPRLPRPDPPGFAEPTEEMISAVVGPRFPRPPGPEHQNFGEPDYSAEVGVFTEPDISEIQCAGAKLIPPIDHHQAPERNGPGSVVHPHPHSNFSPGYVPRPRLDFSPRPRWRYPRPNYPYRTPPPFRANFRPRGRW